MQEKLKQIVHYICFRFKDFPENLGSVKLNKICWFSDVDWYFLSHNTITGHASYVKKPQGPVLPDIKEAINQLDAEGKITAQLVDFSDYKQWYYFCEQDFSDFSVFSGKELKVLDFWIDYARNKSAQTMSSHAHDYPWWKDKFENDAIPVSYGVFKRNLISGSALREQNYGAEISDI